MADFKPLLIVFVSFFLIGAFLNLFIAPHLDLTSPSPNSVLYSFSDFIENGVDVDISVPIFGDIDFSFSPVTWFWLGIDSVTDFIVEQINLLSYLPDVFVIPFLVVCILVFSWSIVTIVRGN